MKAWMISGAVLAACASTKVASSLPYQILEGHGAYNFKVMRTSPQPPAADKVRTELVVVVGNECARRGFVHFDVADFENGTAEGFCFDKDARKALAVSFAPDVVSNKEAVVKNFTIESLNNKSETKLQVGDKIRKVDGQKLTNMGLLKSQIFHQSMEAATLPLEIVRHGKILTVNEPVTTMANSTFDREDLKGAKAKLN